MPGEIEKTPTANQSVSSPASGTYGEDAALAELEQGLPPMGQPGGPQQEPSPMVEPPDGDFQGGSAGRPPGTFSGVPGGVLGPTTQPGVPVNTPLAQPTPPLGGAQDARSARLFLLQTLSKDQTVSEETRAWANELLGILSGP